jgi:tetratricopeptide (TPR) repeat protein
MANAVDELLNQAAQARRVNRLSDAMRDLVEAVARCRKDGDQLRLARSLTALGQIERDKGNVAAALQHYEEAVGIYCAEGDAIRLAHAMRHVGDIHQDAGELKLAEPCYNEALAIYRAHKETPPLDLANAIRGMALLKEATGKTQEALALWEEAGKLYASVNVEAGVAESKRRVGLLKQKNDLTAD